MKDHDAPRHLAIRVDKETALGYDVRYLWSNHLKDLRYLFRVETPRRSMTGTSCLSSVAHMNKNGSEALLVGRSRLGGPSLQHQLFLSDLSAEQSDAHSSQWIYFPFLYLLFAQDVHSGPSQGKRCAKCKIQMSVRYTEVPHELIGCET